MHGEVDRNQVDFERNLKIYLTSKPILWNNLLTIICLFQFGVFGFNNWALFFLM